MTELLKLATALTLKKYTKEQTDAASAAHGINPDSLEAHHFDELNLIPDIIKIDHSAGTVWHKGVTYTIDTWNVMVGRGEVGN